MKIVIKSLETVGELIAVDFVPMPVIQWQNGQPVQVLQPTPMCVVAIEKDGVAQFAVGGLGDMAPTWDPDAKIGDTVSTPIRDADTIEVTIDPQAPADEAESPDA